MANVGKKGDADIQETQKSLQGGSKQVTGPYFPNIAAMMTRSLLIAFVTQTATAGQAPTSVVRRQQLELARDFENLRISDEHFARLVYFLPRSAARLLGAGLDSRDETIHFRVVLENGVETTLNAKIPHELAHSLAQSGFCSQRKRCRIVGCPVCVDALTPGVSRDHRIKNLERQFGSLDGLINKIDHLTRSIQAKKLTITDLMGQQREIYGGTPLFRRVHRARKQRLEDIRAERLRLEREIANNRHQIKQLENDVRTWKAVAAGKEPPSSHVARDLTMLGIGADIIGLILTFVPHPAVRAIGIALDIGGAGLSIWTVMDDGSDRRISVPVNRDQSRSLITSGVCRDGNRCGGPRCPLCGWERRSKD